MKKKIVIVGASSGLGKELALLLHKKGAELFVLSRTIDIGHFPKIGITKVVCDVTNAMSIKEAFSEIDKATKQIDVLINCAGIGLEQKLERVSPEKIKQIIDTNLVGAILVSQEGYRRMLKAKKGYIINISSTSGKKARALETVYCASKWGLAGFSESLRLEARDHGIRVTTVYPGGMKTSSYDDNREKDTSTFMNPEYVAQQIVYLLESDDSITPSELVIERS
jgi:short-subunit dehydrogenase